MRISDWSSDVCSSDLTRKRRRKHPTASRWPALRARGGHAPAGPSALARLEAAVGLVDHIGPAAAANQAIVPVAVLQRLQAVENLHGLDRKNVVLGKRVAIRVCVGGHRMLNY